MQKNNCKQMFPTENKGNGGNALCVLPKSILKIFEAFKIQLCYFQNTVYLSVITTLEKQRFSKL